MEKEQIEEAVVENETALVLPTEFTAPVLVKILDKDACLTTIKQAREKHSKIVIEGTKDKENYKLVASGLSELRNSRLMWSKAIDQVVVGPAKDWLKELTDGVKEITEEFKAGEADLKSKKDAIDELKKSEKEADERKKTERLTQRIEKLVGLGGKNTGKIYSFDYDLTLFVPVDTLRELDDAKWEKKLKEVQDAFDVEQTRLADEKKASDALIAEANALNEQNKATRRRLRLKELKMTGFVQDDTGAYVMNNVEISEAGIDTISDEEWERYMEKAEEELSFDKEEEDLSFPAPAAAVPAVKTPTEFKPLASAYFTTDPVTGFEPPKDDEEEEPAFVPTTPPPAAVQDNPTGWANAITIYFTDKMPFIDFTLSAVLNQRIFPTSKLKEASVGLVEGTYSIGTINEDLSFIAYKK